VGRFILGGVPTVAKPKLNSFSHDGGRYLEIRQKRIVPVLPSKYATLLPPALKQFFANVG
jgi:hypothetical protein